MRVVRPDGSRRPRRRDAPGHYVEPSFSPDGKSIVYRHAGGDDTRGPFYAEDAGIYVVPAAGGEPLLARESGSDRSSITPAPASTCARSATRSTRSSSVGVPTAASPVPGRDEIEHVRSDNATQLVPSPDGKWIAFEERFKTFVAPFPHTGRPIDVGPATQAYPVQRVSRDAGFYLHWSGDGRRLYWALGPELFTRDLTNSFTFVEGAADKAAEPEAKGVPIGFTVEGDMPTGIVALVGARVITMAGLAAGPIQGHPASSRTQRSSSTATASPPSGQHRRSRFLRARQRIDVTGKTIMPGIIDVHGHSAASRAACLRKRAGRSPPTWRSA